MSNPGRFIAEHVKGMPRSGIRDFFDIVQRIPGIISLGIGEPDFVTPWHIREAAIYSLESGHTSYTSNYLSLKFEEQEKSYYQDFFKKYFDDCKIQINNSNRFLHYYATYYTKESDSDEWIDHTDKNPGFNQYMSLVNDSEFKNCMTIAVTQKEANQYITTEDSLKAALMDLQHEEIKLDGNFYVVKTLDDDYTKNHTFAAKIDGYIYSDKTNHLGGHYKYKYTKF